VCVCYNSFGFLKLIFNAFSIKTVTFIDAQKLTNSFGVVRKCGCNFLVFYFGIFMSKFKKKLLRGYLRWPLLPRVQLWCQGLKFESETFKAVSCRLRLLPLMIVWSFLIFIFQCFGHESCFMIIINLFTDQVWHEGISFLCKLTRKAN